MNVKERADAILDEAILEHLDDLSVLLLGQDSESMTREEKLVGLLRMSVFCRDSIENPAVKFTKDARDGAFEKLTDGEYDYQLRRVQYLCDAWKNQKAAAPHEIVRNAIVLWDGTLADLGPSPESDPLEPSSGDNDGPVE